MVEPKKISALDAKATVHDNDAFVIYDFEGATAPDQNKKITGANMKSQMGVEEITTVASSATPAPTGGSLRNLFTVTALAVGATFAAPSGTPANGNRLIVRIKDDGAARSLAWNAIYRAMEFALPTTTVISKTMYLGFIYNSADSKWDMVAINEEA